MLKNVCVSCNDRHNLIKCTGIKTSYKTRPIKQSKGGYQAAYWQE